MTINGFRVALTTSDFDRITSFYQDGLGLDPGELWIEDGGRGQMFFAGQATLEVFDHDYASHIDSIEVGQRVSGQIRFAFEVADLDETLQHAQEFGAALIAEPKLTPWGDINARIESPDGIQITLYQVNNSTF